MYMLIFKYLLFSRIDTIEVQQWSMYSSLIAKKIGIVFFMLVWLKRIICQRHIYLFFRYISVYKDYFYRYMTFGIKKAQYSECRKSLEFHCFKLLEQELWRRCAYTMIILYHPEVEWGPSWGILHNVLRSGKIRISAWLCFALM